MSYFLPMRRIYSQEIRFQASV